MRYESRLMLGVCLAGLGLLVGCDKSGSTTSAPASPPSLTPGGGAGPMAGGAAPAEVAPFADDMTPVAIADGQVALTPENTLIQFVGSHTDKSKPDHVGGFEKFTGTIKINSDKAIESIEVNIDTMSLFTGNDKLSDHLKHPDFLDANEHPQIKFVSKSVEATPVQGDLGRIEIVGDLTLHGVTKEVSFPATLNIADDKLTLKSEFKIDRTEFDMKLLTDSVEKEVALTIVVGGKTARPS